MADRVGEQRELAAVEIGGVRASSFSTSWTLRDLALEVDVEVVDRLLDHLQLVDQEVGGVAFVGLGFQESTGVSAPARRGCNREIGRYSASQ